jgi:hypothetical protein
MPAYDFQRLSPQDFEELVRDLLQCEWGMRLESFTAGRDAGIDLRCLRHPEDIVIIQCKHTPNANFSQLLRDLRKTELPKVRALEPNRYLIVTSRGLTPANKESLKELFSPYVQNENDVLGREDIENLLRRHPKVEQSNFKLWLTSTAVMNKVLHNAEHCQTEFEVDRVLSKLPVFVQSEAFPRAQKILAETHTVVISGSPGVGKTTLADMLLYAHLERGFEPVVIQGGIVEAKNRFDKSSPQIFYFDDFLGSTFFNGSGDLVSRNQDASLISFIDAIGRSQNSRFVLTTREHVLRNALESSERLAHSQLLNHRCILELGDYTYNQKARILYNHLYFSDLPQNYRDEILNQEFYLKIVKHPNFVPRLIDWLSGYVRVKNVPIDQYRNHITKLLESPEEIWLYAFDHQISKSARHLLLSMAASKYGIDIVDLKPIWTSLHEHCSKKYNFTTAPRDFERALDELDGSFITLGTERITFANPSIHDFVDNVIRNSEVHIHDHLDSAVRFIQPLHLLDLAAARPSTALAATIFHSSPKLISCFQRVLRGPHLRWTEKVGAGKVGTYLDSYPETRVSRLIAWTEKEKSNVLLELQRQAFEFFMQMWQDRKLRDVSAAISIVKALDQAPWVTGRGGQKSRSDLLEVALGELGGARFDDWLAVLKYRKDAVSWDETNEFALRQELIRYTEGGIDDEAQWCTSTSELEELRDGLVSIQADYGIRLENSILSVEQRLENFYEPSEHQSGFDDPTFLELEGQNTRDVPDDEEIRNLFRTLM